MMRALLVKLGRYFVTAGLAAIVDIGGFVLLVGAGMALVPAAASSFVVAALVNYLASSRFVFGAPASVRGFGRFFAGALAGLAINVGVTFLAATQLGLVPALAKTVGVGVAFLANFAINATLVFPGAGAAMKAGRNRSEAGPSGTKLLASPLKAAGRKSGKRL